MITAANFHYIRPDFELPHPGIHGVLPSEFEHQLDELARAFTFVSASDIERAAVDNTQLPPNALVITFDDGLREQFEYAWPILQRKRIPAIFYINTRPLIDRCLCSVHKLHLIRAYSSANELESCLRAALPALDIDSSADLTNLAREQYHYDEIESARFKYLLNFVLTERQKDAFVEENFKRLFGEAEAEMSANLYMSPAMVEELDSHGCIGTHAHDHLPLTQLPASAANREIASSLHHLRSWGCKNVCSISYPFGGKAAVSKLVADSAASLGLKFGFTMERATNVSLRWPLLLARFSNSDLPAGNAASWSIDEVPDRLPRASWFN